MKWNKVILTAMAGILLTGCSASGEREYTREELQNTARIEIYEAGSDELLKTIEDGETLYQYLQVCEYSEYSDTAYEEQWAVWEGELEKEAGESAGESYYLVVYKYPASKFGNKEPVKTYTTVLYQDSDIAKTVAEDDVIKIISLPEELLTFYYRMSEEEQEFYGSLIEQG